MKATERRTPEKIAIGHRLEAALAAAQISRKEICEKLGISQNKWSQWATGVNMPSMDDAIRVCEELGITLYWIFRGDARDVAHGLASKLLKLVS